MSNLWVLLLPGFGVRDFLFEVIRNHFPDVSETTLWRAKGAGGVECRDGDRARETITRGPELVPFRCFMTLLD